MVEIFLMLAVAFLAILGLSETMHYICIAVIKPKVKPRKVLVVYLTKRYAEEQLLSAIEEMRWHGTRYADAIIAVTADLGDEEKLLCRDRFGCKGVFFTDKLM